MFFLIVVLCTFADFGSLSENVGPATSDPLASLPSAGDLNQATDLPDRSRTEVENQGPSSGPGNVTASTGHRKDILTSPSRSSTAASSRVSSTYFRKRSTNTATTRHNHHSHHSHSTTFRPTPTTRSRIKTRPYKKTRTTARGKNKSKKFTSGRIRNTTKKVATVKVKPPKSKSVATTSTPFKASSGTTNLDELEADSTSATKVDQLQISSSSPADATDSSLSATHRTTESVFRAEIESPESTSVPARSTAVITNFDQLKTDSDSPTKADQVKPADATVASTVGAHHV